MVVRAPSSGEVPDDATALAVGSATQCVLLTLGMLNILCRSDCSACLRKLVVVLSAGLRRCAHQGLPVDECGCVDAADRCPGHLAYWTHAAFRERPVPSVSGGPGEVGRQVQRYRRYGCVVQA